MMSLNGTKINIVVLLLQFNLAGSSLAVTNFKFEDVILSKELCPDPISRSNSSNFINQLPRSVVSPLYIIDDSGQSLESCYYEPKSQIKDEVPEYSVTVRYIRLSINPWSRNNNTTCKTFLQIDQRKKHDMMKCTMLKSSDTWHEWGLGPPTAAYYYTNQFLGFVVSFPKHSLTAYNYLQIYFSISASNSNVWRIQQYAIRKEDCDKYIPDYPVCADYSYILDPEYTSSSADTFSGIEKSEYHKTMENDIISSRDICPRPVFFGTLKHYLYSANNEHEYYKAVYISSTSKNCRCIFESDENEKGHKDIIIVKGMYASVSIDWSTFSGQLTQCPEFIQFSTRKINNENQTKLCELADTTVSNIKYNPSIWITTRHGELSFSYATFPKENNLRSSALNKKFYIYFFHKTKFKCTLRIQQYEKTCQNKDVREYCRSYGDCSNERDVWSTIILENIQHQYSDEEYKYNGGHQAFEQNSEVSHIYTSIGPYLMFLCFISVVLVMIICGDCCYKRRRCNSEVTMLTNYEAANDPLSPIASFRRHSPLVGRSPTAYYMNQRFPSYNGVAETAFRFPPTAPFEIPNSGNQTFPTSSTVAEETVFSFPPTAPVAIVDSGNRTADTNASVENPPPYEICNQDLPTYAEATS